MTRTIKGAPHPHRRAPSQNLVSLLGLALLVWGIVANFLSSSRGSDRSLAICLLVLAVLSWTVVVVILRRDMSRTAEVAIITMAVAGGVLSGLTQLAIVFTAVACLYAGLYWPFSFAAVTVGAGWVAAAITLAVHNPSLGQTLGDLATLLAGALVGTTRRQSIVQPEMIAQRKIDEARAEVEKERSQLLA